VQHLESDERWRKTGMTSVAKRFIEASTVSCGISPSGLNQQLHRLSRKAAYLLGSLGCRVPHT
jgi:hypothetical protein